MYMFFMTDFVISCYPMRFIPMHTQNTLKDPLFMANAYLGKTEASIESLSLAQKMSIRQSIEQPLGAHPIII